MELSGPANGLRVCGDKQESRLSAVQGNASGNLCGSVCTETGIVSAGNYFCSGLIIEFMF